MASDPLKAERDAVIEAASELCHNVPIDPSYAAMAVWTMKYLTVLSSAIADLRKKEADAHG